MQVCLIRKKDVLELRDIRNIIINLQLSFATIMVRK